MSIPLEFCLMKVKQDFLKTGFDIMGLLPTSPEHMIKGKIEGNENSFFVGSPLLAPTF